MISCVGRKRIYPSHAARQKAYRERKKQAQPKPESLPLTAQNTPPGGAIPEDEIPPDPEWLEDRGAVRYSHGKLEFRQPGETVWREKVEDGPHTG
jgi:hypothetical protein